jgi:DNA gyrase subunit A
VVLNQLYRFTALQSHVRRQHGGARRRPPLVMTLKDLLTLFLAFREEVISRRTKFLLGKARDRAHILVGLAIAVANIDEVIRMIRASKDANEARGSIDGQGMAGSHRGVADCLDRRSHAIASRRKEPPG